jgi:hypothetical protein
MKQNTHRILVEILFWKTITLGTGEIRQDNTKMDIKKIYSEDGSVWH